MENPAENAQDTATDDLLLADSPEDDDPILEEPAPARQGLPPGFRMRHDRHYVDELMGMRVASARPAPHVVEPAPAPLPAPSREQTDETPRSVRAALVAVAERLDVVRQHAAAGRRTAQPTSFDRALQVEVDRASRLAHAAVAIAGGLEIARRETTTAEIAERTKGAIAALRKFSGIRFEISVDDPAFRIAVDQAAVTHAIAGTLHAMSDLLDTSADVDDLPLVRIRMHAVQPRPALMVEIAAAGIALGEQATATFFDPGADRHPAGTEGALLLGAAATVARTHGGRADARRGSDGGLVVLFVLPR